MRQMHTQQHSRKPGQAAVEFALAAMILLLVLFGILELGRLVLANSEIANAAREGSHYLALNPRATRAEVEAQIQSHLVTVDRSAIQGSNVEIACASCTQTDDCAISPAPDGCKDYSYQPVTVAVTYTWASVLPVPGLSGGVQLVGRSTTLRER